MTQGPRGALDISLLSPIANNHTTGLYGCYAIGGLPYLRNSRLSASVMSACWLVSCSAARNRSCFLAAVVAQNGSGARPARSGRGTLVRSAALGWGTAAKTPVAPSVARCLLMLLLHSFARCY